MSLSKALYLALVAIIATFLVASCSGGGDNLERESSGFDSYGYNDQARQFDGYYFNTYAEGAGFDPWTPGDDAAYLAANPGAGTHWAWPYRTTRLKMKWNAAWDYGNEVDWAPANQDGFEDAWLTNHMWDSYVDGGETETWNYFTKIVWVGPDGELWGQFHTIQEVYNDTGTGEHGNIPIPGPNGFGVYP